MLYEVITLTEIGVGVTEVFKGDALALRLNDRHQAAELFAEPQGRDPGQQAEDAGKKAEADVFNKVFESAIRHDHPIVCVITSYSIHYTKLYEAGQRGCRMRRLFGLVALLLLSACGYRLAGDVMPLPQGIETLYVTLFENRTSAPYLHNDLSDELIRRLLRVPELYVQNQEDSAVITSYSIHYTKLYEGTADPDHAPQTVRGGLRTHALFRSRDSRNNFV